MRAASMLALAGGAVLWDLLTARLLGTVALITALALAPHLLRRRRRKAVVLLGVGFVVLTVIPFDLSLQVYPGRPRFVALVMGLPGRETARRAKRHEIMLGGCMVSGFEPRWVWVW